ncbi:MAG: hypothetical protein HC767_08295 [Akkermansiaceae bacterium]|nr:hypothetical protein [Akkermansiaceae bacterium]
MLSTDLASVKNWERWILRDCLRKVFAGILLGKWLALLAPDRAGSVLLSL